jgi:hypothetical protein
MQHFSLDAGRDGRILIDVPLFNVEDLRDIIRMCFRCSDSRGSVSKNLRSLMSLRIKDVSSCISVTSQSCTGVAVLLAARLAVSKRMKSDSNYFYRMLCSASQISNAERDEHCHDGITSFSFCFWHVCFITSLQSFCTTQKLSRLVYLSLSGLSNRSVLFGLDSRICFPDIKSLFTHINLRKITSCMIYLDD